MSGNLPRFSTHCPVCRGVAEVGLMFGRIIACGFCLGRGVVYAVDGEAARARRDKARDIVAATMRQWEGLP